MFQSHAPVVEWFRIRGMHGYKDVEIDFSGPARIVIAENGSGKTRILWALDRFLSGRLYELKAFAFEAIECKFRNLPNAVVLQRAALIEQQAATSSARELLAEWAAHAEVEVDDLRAAIKSVLSDPEADWRTNSLLLHVYHSSPFGEPDMVAGIEQVRAEMESAEPGELEAIEAEVRSAVKGIGVLYLPTYRRVELSKPKDVIKRQNEYANFLSRRKFSKRYKVRGLGESIQYGLSDVQERLNEILGEIQRQSNHGYRLLSANIIDDLLTAQLRESGAAGSVLPDIDALSLFFSRIEGGRPSGRLAAVDTLYKSGDIKKPEHDMLRYFLEKLSRVVNQTKELESSVERFVNKVNDYLSTSGDEKKLIYDAQRMKVIVRNTWTDSNIALDDLSSGEKQVISMLGHLYLYQDDKIVLIDEPELSLSMEWQRKLLPDIMNSPTCIQLLAITHSPFTFENELDAYAGPLNITRRKAKSS
jgi:predicted ATPase